MREGLLPSARDGFMIPRKSRSSCDPGGQLHSTAASHPDQSHPLADGGKETVWGSSGRSALSEDPPYGFEPNLTTGGARNSARTLRSPASLRAKWPMSVFHHKRPARTASVFSPRHNTSFNYPFVTHILETNNINVNTWGSIVPSVESVQ